MGSSTVENEQRAARVAQLASNIRGMQSNIGRIVERIDRHSTRQLEAVDEVLRLESFGGIDDCFDRLACVLSPKDMATYMRIAQDCRDWGERTLDVTLGVAVAAWGPGIACEFPGTCSCGSGRY